MHCKCKITAVVQVFKQEFYYSKLLKKYDEMNVLFSKSLEFIFISKYFLNNFIVIIKGFVILRGTWVGQYRKFLRPVIYCRYHLKKINPYKNGQKSYKSKFN